MKALIDLAGMAMAAMSKQSDDSSSGGLSDLLGGITGGGEDAGLDDLVGLAKKLF